MKNIFVNQARKKVTDKALKAAKDALAAKKAKEAAEAAAKAERQRQLAQSRRVIRDSGGGDSWREQTAAKEAAGVQVAGPGFGKGAYFKSGGSVKSKPEMKLDKAKRDSALYQGLYMMLEELPGIMSLFFKNGGVVKTDLTDTIPPERGPMSSGVESLFKRK